jgi:uncharacterized protein
MLAIAIDSMQLHAICQRHHITKLAVFGSVLRDDFGDDSDIDIVVEFDPRFIPGWNIVTIARELSELWGREVDLTTFRALHPRLRDSIVTTMQVLYERA